MQKKKREDCVNQLNETIEGQLRKLDDELDTNKKTRESTNKKILKMVGEIKQKL